MNIKIIILALLIVIVSAAIPLLFVSATDTESQVREFHIRARQYAYDPPVITVNKGDEIHIRLSSLDVVHGFFLEGYDIDAEIEPGKKGFLMRHPSEGDEFFPVEEIVFTAERTGKFRYRCSHTCGTLHPFMLGEFIVRPNYPYLAAMGATVGIFIAMFMVFFLAKSPKKVQEISPAHAAG